MLNYQGSQSVGMFTTESWGIKHAAYADRKNAPLIDEWIGGSNYLPALEKVHRLPNLGYHDQLALSVYFFSDNILQKFSNIEVGWSTLDDIFLKKYIKQCPKEQLK